MEIILLLEDKLKFFVFFLMFFIVSGLIIINNENLHISNSDDLKIFSLKYESWFSEIYSNVFSITGNIAKLDWIPE